MGKSSTPPPPDYNAIALQQGQMNKEAALEQWRLQNSPVQTPYGKRNLIADPTSPSGYKLTEELDPAEQSRLDKQRTLMSGLLDLGPGALNYLGGIIGKPVDPGNLPPMPYGVNTEGLQYGVDRGNMVSDVNFSGLPSVSSGADTRNRVEQAMKDRFTAFAEPKQQAAQAALQNRIANMGGVTSNPAARRMLFDLGKAQSDERMNAGFEAISRGGEEATREFGMDSQRRQQSVAETLARAGFINESQAQDLEQRLAQGGFRNTAVNQNIANMFQNAGLALGSRAQGLQEFANLRQMPLNELMAMLGGTQVNPMSFTGGGSATWSPADIYGAAKDTYGTQVGAANAKKAQSSGILSAAGGIAGGMFGGPMGAMAGSALGGAISDRRLKENIIRIGATPAGLPIYSYTLFGEHQFGVMADEVERVFPEAVAEHPFGFKVVNYALIG